MSAGPRLLQLEHDGRRIGGGDRGSDLSADGKGGAAAAPGQQHEERVGVAVDHARAPGRVRLHHADCILQRLPRRLPAGA